MAFSGDHFKKLKCYEKVLRGGYDAAILPECKGKNNQHHFPLSWYLAGGFSGYTRLSSGNWKRTIPVIV
jgi:hypothetical protein